MGRDCYGYTQSSLCGVVLVEKGGKNGCGEGPPDGRVECC